MRFRKLKPVCFQQNNEHNIWNGRQLDVDVNLLLQIFFGVRVHRPIYKK